MTTVQSLRPFMRRGFGALRVGVACAVLGVASCKILFMRGTSYSFSYNTQRHKQTDRQSCIDPKLHSDFTILNTDVHLTRVFDVEYRLIDCRLSLSGFILFFRRPMLILYAVNHKNVSLYLEP